MESKTAKWLSDIQESIQEINDFILKNQIHSFSNYQKNKMLKRAVERNLEIIGEAVNRVKQNDAATFEKIELARSIIAPRNHVIHAYDSISDEIEHDANDTQRHDCKMCEIPPRYSGQVVAIKNQIINT